MIEKEFEVAFLTQKLREKQERHLWAVGGGSKAERNLLQGHTCFTAAPLPAAPGLRLAAQPVVRTGPRLAVAPRADLHFKK